MEIVFLLITIQTNSKCVFKHKNINTSIRSTTYFKQLLGKHKTKLLDGGKSGKYKINCDNCEMKYNGQTKRKLKIRIKEHKAC